MPRTDGVSPPPAPRPCRACGGATGRSHVAYLGGGTEAVVYRCESCGATSQGPPQNRSQADAQRAQQGRGGRNRERRPLDGGALENPVIDADLARQLRERFGGSD